MHWIRKTSSFRYCGRPVTRVSLTSYTPLGNFKVYEAVSGKVFAESPFNNKNMGATGFIPDPDNTFGQWPRIECTSLREGVNKCNEIWNKAKAKINSI